MLEDLTAHDELEARISEGERVGTADVDVAPREVSSCILHLDRIQVDGSTGRLLQVLLQTLQNQSFSTADIQSRTNSKRCHEPPERA